MRHWQRASRLQRWLGALLAVVVLLTTVAVIARRHPTAAAALSAVSTAVYLPDPSAPALDLAAVREQGVQVVADPTALFEVTSRTTTGAVLLDRAMFDALPAAWLAAQVRQGRIVVGFDVPADRFTRLAGLDRHLSTANMRLDWQGVPFYSWAYQRESAGQIKNAGLNSDALYSTDVFFGRLRSKIDGSSSLGLGPPVQRPPDQHSNGGDWSDDRGGGMREALRSLPLRGSSSIVSALALRAIPTPAAPVADLYPYGAALSHLYTHAASGINNGGQYEWRATAYARDGYSGDSGRIRLQGWNNSRGWHATGADICYLTGGAPGDCYISPTAYDAGPHGILPGSQSTDRYVTTEHFLFWAGGADNFYTSADGRHSSYACFTRSGSCP